jgi:transposase
MRKIKDVLRLRYELGLGQRQIARSCSIGQATVAEYLKRAKAVGIGWPLPDGWDDAQLHKAVFGSPEPPVARKGKPLPELAEVREQLQRHRNLTLQLIWEEYRQKHPDGYSYSYFCEQYERWRRTQDVVLRQQHRPARRCS